MTTISIAMATFNGARFLDQQLRSLADQVLPPAELVITDDGSEDRTLEIAGDFARTAPFPVRVLRNQTRLGYRENFLRNAGTCMSDLVAFCDQDDVWHPRKLFRAVPAFDDPDVVLFHHNAQLINHAGKRLGKANIMPVAPRNAPCSLHPYRWALGFQTVFRRDLMRLFDHWPMSIDAMEPHHRMSHDMWIYFLASVFGQIVYLDEDLADYRQHDRNSVGFRGVRTVKDGLRHWREKIGFGAEDFSRLAMSSARRAEILDLAGTGLDGEWRARAARASSLYRAMAQRYENRANVYRDHSLARRMGAMTQLLRAGAYGFDNPWGFSYRNLIKDVAMMLLRPGGFPRQHGA